MSSKLKIRIGEVEVEYEGTEEFLKQDLPALLKSAMDLHEAASSRKGNTKQPAGDLGNGNQDRRLSCTTTTIAAKLNATSGPDLIYAAAGNLALVAGKDTFSRQQIHNEMKTATSYYNKNFSPNMTKYLQRAIKDDRLTEVSSGSYALTAKARADLERKLADA